MRCIFFCGYFFLWWGLVYLCVFMYCIWFSLQVQIHSLTSRFSFLRSESQPLLHYTYVYVLLLCTYIWFCSHTVTRERTPHLARAPGQTTSRADGERVCFHSKHRSVHTFCSRWGMMVCFFVYVLWQSFFALTEQP